MLVSDLPALEALVSRLRGVPVLAIDTEFLRERTYWARCCLVQLAAGDEVAAVDAIALPDLSPLAVLLEDPATVKVFHAGSQDLEILRRATGATTAPVFDTQTAATLAGFPTQVGYAALVKGLLGVTVEKGESYTDWAVRPLTEHQLAYALDDVRHLGAVHAALIERLERDDRLQWLEADFARMADPATYEVVPEEQWRRIKRASTLKPRQLGVLLHVAAWREREAQRRDLPKRWVVSDESLIEVARRAPRSAEEVAAVRGIAVRSAAQIGPGLVAAVRAGLELPEDQLPHIEKRPRLVRDTDGAVDLMAALVRLRAKEHGVASPLIASRNDLEHLAAGGDDSPLLEGWRKTLVGDELMDLLAGRLTLRLADGRVRVERRDG